MTKCQIPITKYTQNVLHYYDELSSVLCICIYYFAQIIIILFFWAQFVKFVRKLWFMANNLFGEFVVSLFRQSEKDKKKKVSAELIKER